MQDREPGQAPALQSLPHWVGSGFWTGPWPPGLLRVMEGSVEANPFWRERKVGIVTPSQLFPNQELPEQICLQAVVVRRLPSTAPSCRSVCCQWPCFPEGMQPAPQGRQPTMGALVGHGPFSRAAEAELHVGFKCTRFSNTSSTCLSEHHPVMSPCPGWLSTVPPQQTLHLTQGHPQGGAAQEDLV